MNDKNEQGRNKAFAVTSRTVIIFFICIALILIISQFDMVSRVFDWLAGILSPVFVGVILAYIINPVARVIERWIFALCSRSDGMSARLKHKLSLGLGVLFSVIFMLMCIALLLFLIIPEFLESLEKLIVIVPSLFTDVVADISELTASDSAFMHNFGAYIDAAINKLVEWIGGEFSAVVSGLAGSVISVVNFLFDFLISLVVCVYALIERDRFVAQSKKLLFALCETSRANDILDVARYGNEIFGKFISGKLITSTIVGIVTFVFMTVMGMPYALLSAGVIAVTNIIPFFGPFIGGIPTAFIVLLTDFRYGIIYAIFLVVLQQLEGNVIEPMIMEDRTGVSKFWVTAALLLFGGVFGIAGMIFSVPLIAVLFYIIRICVERKLEEKSLPIPSGAYQTVGSVDPGTGEMLPPPKKEPKKTLLGMFSQKKDK